MNVFNAKKKCKRYKILCLKNILPFKIDFNMQDLREQQQQPQKKKKKKKKKNKIIMLDIYDKIIMFDNG